MAIISMMMWVGSVGKVVRIIKNDEATVLDCVKAAALATAGVLLAIFCL